MYWKDYPINKVSIDDPRYPKILKKIPSPPRQLYFRAPPGGGLNSSLFKTSLAVVGSRRMTQYGKMVVEKFVSNLALNGVTIISGFMYGVDSEAHRICVENEGKTLAVFGCGLDICYPPENDELYTHILEKGGAVISEYEPDAKAHLWKFPQRNRIVAGLANLGVLVIEAGAKSGSLVTAKLALKQKKKVFAVPGPITSSTSMGTNELIKSGEAKMVTGPEDVLANSKLKIQNAKLQLKSQNQVTNTEKGIAQLLEAETLSTDEIAKKLKKDIVEVSTALSLMALKGSVYEAGGKYYLS